MLLAGGSSLARLPPDSEVWTFCQSTNGASYYSPATPWLVVDEKE